MWISKKRFEAMENELRDLRKELQEIKYKAPTFEKFIVREGVLNPYAFMSFGQNQLDYWTTKPIELSLPSAIRMLADHVGVTFSHEDTKPARIFIEPIAKTKKA